MPTPLPSQARLKELLDYEPHGGALVWSFNGIKFRASIIHNEEEFLLGTFPTPEEAQKAFIDAATALVCKPL